MLFNLLEATRGWLIETGLHRYLQVLDQITFRALLAGVLSFFLVVGFGRPVISYLTRKKIGDAGMTDAAALQAAAASKKNTPTMGGVLIAGAIAVSTLLLADLSNRYVIMGLLALLWLACLGGADDWLKLTGASRKGGSRQGLYAWEKLVFQLGLGLLLGYFCTTRATAARATTSRMFSTCRSRRPTRRARGRTERRADLPQSLVVHDPHDAHDRGHVQRGEHHRRDGRPCRGHHGRRQHRAHRACAWSRGGKRSRSTCSCPDVPGGEGSPSHGRRDGRRVPGLLVELRRRASSWATRARSVWAGSSVHRGRGPPRAPDPAHERRVPP